MVDDPKFQVHLVLKVKLFASPEGLLCLTSSATLIPTLARPGHVGGVDSSPSDPSRAQPDLGKHYSGV